jgi:hypothetical protein
LNQGRGRKALPFFPAQLPPTEIMSFFRDLFYALAAGRIVGSMIRERRRRVWQRRPTYADPTPAPLTRGPWTPVIPQGHAGKKPR